MSFGKLLFGFALMLVSLRNFAHHSISPYDSTRFHEVEGVVTKLSWRNPHMELVLSVINSDGDTETWNIEADAVNTLTRRGLTRQDLAVGQTLRFYGRPSSRGRNELFARNVLLENGLEFVMTVRDRPYIWTDKVEQIATNNSVLPTDIFRVWSFNNQSYRRKGEFKLTEAAKKAVADFDPITDNPSLRCIPPGMPNGILNPYPFELVDENDQIRLRIEEWGVERIIDMVSSEIPEDAPRTRYGYSIGKLVGNSLEVRTARFTEHLLDDDGIPMSSDGVMFEVFTLNPEENVLAYEVTITDPINLLEPAVWTHSKKWDPAISIQPFECNVDDQ